MKPRRSGYDGSVGASERPSVQTLGEGEGRLEIALTGKLRNAIFRDFSEKSEKNLIFTCLFNKG